jgi:hypothetical protein
LSYFIIPLLFHLLHLILIFSSTFCFPPLFLSLNLLLFPSLTLFFPLYPLFPFLLLFLPPHILRIHFFLVCASCLLLDGYLLGLFFNPEDGDSAFLRNTDNLLPQ